MEKFPIRQIFELGKAQLDRASYLHSVIVFHQVRVATQRYNQGISLRPYIEK